MVSKMTMISQVIGHLFATPARLAFCQELQFLLDCRIISFLGAITIGATIQMHGSAGLPLAQTVFIHQACYQLASLFRF